MATTPVQDRPRAEVTPEPSFDLDDWQPPESTPPRRRFGKPIAIGVVIVILLSLGWIGLRRLSVDSGGGAVITYEVAPRTFDVVLSEKGELDALNKIDIKSEVEGQTRIISLVPEGKHVEKGELLVQLASDQIDDRIQQEELKETAARVAYEAAVKEHEIQLDKNESDIRKAELAVTIAGLKLEKYTKGDWEQQMTDAQLEIDRCERVLQRDQDDLKYSKELIEKQFITQSEYKDDEFAVYQATVALEKAKLAKDILHEYTHKTDLQQLESDLHEAEKELERVKKTAEANAAKSQANVDGKNAEWNHSKQQLQKYREQKEKCHIIAPGAGLVVYSNQDSFWRGNQSRIAEGEQVYERQTILSIPDTSQMKVVVRIHEAKTQKLETGLRARIEVEGMPDQEFTGEVTKIAAVADSRSRWLNPDLKEYRTEITIDQNDAPLKPGVTARVSIFVERVDAKAAVPVQAVYSKGGKSYAFVDNGGEATPVEVTLGQSNAEFVEVTDGLSVGQHVRMVIDDDLKRMLPDVSVDEAAEPPPLAPEAERRAEPQRPDESQDEHHERGEGRPKGGGRPSGGGPRRQG